MAKIPPSLIGVSARILSDEYTHAELDSLFMAAGFDGEPPLGNKMHKCQQWMRSENSTNANALSLFGKLVAEFLDSPASIIENSEYELGEQAQKSQKNRDQIREVLALEELVYKRGGIIFERHLATPSTTLGELLEQRGVEALDQEYRRAYDSVESDPDAAIAAACAILESLCKVYLESEGHDFPRKQGLGDLWKSVSKHLGFIPENVEDQDLKRILSGLFSLADGVAALRTHASSAHGRSELQRKRYRAGPRHARLAVHAAHTMAIFILETWENQDTGVRR